jgi:hypothetical protein
MGCCLAGVCLLRWQHSTRPPCMVLLHRHIKDTLHMLLDPTSAHAPHHTDTPPPMSLTPTSAALAGCGF